MIKLSSLNKGLMGHWSLDQESYNPATRYFTDKTPASKHMLSANAATFGTDQKGHANRATVFDGTDTTRLVGSYNPLFNPDNGFSVWCWVYPTAINIGDIVSQYTGGLGNNRQWTLQFHSDSIRLLSYSDGATQTTSSLYPASVDTWYCVEGYFDKTAQEMGLIINASEYGTPTALAGIIDVDQPIRISYAVNDGYVTGRIPVVRLYDHVLTQIERTLLYEMYRSKLVIG